MAKHKRTRAESDLEATSIIFFAMMSDVVAFDCVTPFAEMAKNTKTKKFIYDSAKKGLPKKRKK